MPRGVAAAWSISGRSAFVAATVVFVSLAVAAAALATVLYRSMLSGVDTAAATRVVDIADALRTTPPAALDPALMATDERIVAVQVITAGGTVVERSSSAPRTPLIPIDEVGEGIRIGMPEHASPFGRIRFSAQTVDGVGGRYTVLVGEGSLLVASTVKTVIVALAIAAPIVVAVSAAATYLLVRRSMRSVDDIRTRVADISTSDLTERVPVPGSRDEIAALAVTMNEMLARIEAGHTAQQRFVGDASHELRSPLASIISALEVAAAHPELNQELAKSTLAEAHRMEALVADLLLLARADEEQLAANPTDVDLDDVAAAEVDRLQRISALRVRASLEPAQVRGAAPALSRVLRNLLDNAERHASTAIDVELHARKAQAVLTVDDDGPGIAVADRDRVFDRFVRLDQDRSRSAGGAGLGLAIVREIVAAHGGTVAIGESPGGGTRVTVQLPLSYAPESSR